MYIGFFVDFYDELEEEPSRAVGIVEVDSYAKAVERITHFYGETNVNKVELIPLVRDYPIISIKADSPYGENLEDVIHFLTL